VRALNRSAVLLSVFVVWGIIGCGQQAAEFRSEWPRGMSRVWIGPDYWADRIEDWQLADGRVECVESSQNRPMRALHLLTGTLRAGKGTLRMSVQTGPVDAGPLSRETWTGFLIGAGGENIDYRLTALTHHKPAEDGGLLAAVDGAGHMVFRDNSVSAGETNPWSITGPLRQGDLPELTPESREGSGLEGAGFSSLELRLTARPEGTTYTVTLGAYIPETGALVRRATLTGVPPRQLEGDVALISHRGPGDSENGYWFRDWQITGSKFVRHPDRQYGPVFAALHTLSEGVLNITAQMPPLGKADTRTATLQIKESPDGPWVPADTTSLVDLSYTFPFRVEQWDDSKDTPYRIRYDLVTGPGTTQPYYWEGTIRRNPADKDEFVIAAFTGHKIYTGGLKWNHNGIWFPHNELVAAVKHQNPDLLFFSGDQVYEGDLTGAQRAPIDKAMLDYLDKWYRWCWAFGDLARNIPTVTIPDDHDVYHGNIWGAGGRPPRENPPPGEYPDYYKNFESHYRQDGGGYLMTPDFVNMVQRTQTSHLPAPYDPAPIEENISVYYTDIEYGGLSFAVIEDRKWKSAPSVVLPPEAEVVNGFSQNPNYDVREAGVPGATLLGDRQLDFLREWTASWKDARMKVVLSQTIFADVATYPRDFQTDAGTTELQPLPPDSIPTNYALAKDMDSNGWPQNGRNKALREMRKGFALHVSGDQHLGMTIQYGIDDYRDAGFALCVPSIGNTWPRRWYPPFPGANRDPGHPYYTGDYLDGFGNHITVHAVSNPVKSGHEPSNLYDRAPGYGIVRLHRQSRDITLEVWPRWVDPSHPGAQQYLGWPVTINQVDNYGRKPAAFLPTLHITGLSEPVIQVMDESNGNIVYTLRLNGNPYRPGVFRDGRYTIKIGDGYRWLETLNRVPSLPAEQTKSLGIHVE